MNLMPALKEQKIDLERRNFMLLIVTPKDALFTWLSSHQERKGLQKFKPYSPEQDPVLIVPDSKIFSSVSRSLGAFLDEIKPRRLDAELLRFRATVDDLGLPLTKETFDMFYSLSVRDPEAVMFLTDFK